MFRYQTTCNLSDNAANAVAQDIWRLVQGAMPSVHKDFMSINPYQSLRLGGAPVHR